MRQIINSDFHCDEDYVLLDFCSNFIKLFLDTKTIHKTILVFFKDFILEYTCK